MEKTVTQQKALHTIQTYHSGVSMINRAKYIHNWYINKAMHCQENTRVHYLHQYEYEHV